MKKIILIIIGIVLVVLVGSSVYLYNYFLSPVDKSNTTVVEITIENGESTKMIASKLKEKGLIKNADFFYYYLKINKINTLKASSYKLNKSMSMKEIISVISDASNGFNKDEITITFQEGKNIRQYAKIVENKTNNKAKDFIKKASDSKYLDTLIEKYWFLTKDIKNKDIYYGLEGYLYPDTYNFKNKDVTCEEIIEKLLDQTDLVLSKYKDQIEKSKYSVHEILTLSSMIELEGLRKDDKLNISSVFHNRLKKGISLGSDVTTCYALKIDDTAKCHNEANFNVVNPYNTRRLDKKGLPVGPISNSGEDSIYAALNPNKTNYIYFLADKHTKIYMFENEKDFNAKKQELIASGDWL